MEMSTIERPALGRTHVIGDFYDCRKDCFVFGNVFSRTLPRDILAPVPHADTNFDFKFTTTTKEKHDALKVEGELSLSVLAGLVQLSGSAQYLMESRSNTSTLSCIYTGRVQTTKETLNFANENLSEYVASFSPPEEATHVVVGVTRGSNAFLELNCNMSHNSCKEDIKRALTNKFSNPVDDVGNENMNSYVLENVTDVRLRVFTDAPPLVVSVPLFLAAH